MLSEIPEWSARREVETPVGRMLQGMKCSWNFCAKVTFFSCYGCVNGLRMRTSKPHGIGSALHLYEIKLCLSQKSPCSHCRINLAVRSAGPSCVPPMDYSRGLYR